MILKMKPETIVVLKQFPLFVLVFFIAFCCAFSISENQVDEIITQLPNILGILLAGVLSSLAILLGLLSDGDLYHIRQRNLNKTNNQIQQDKFLNFLTSVKKDTLIIFLSFSITFVLFLFCNLDFSRINYVFNYLPEIVQVQFNYFLLAIGLSCFFLSISSTFDIITSVFVLNQHRYLSSNENEKEKK